MDRLYIVTIWLRLLIIESKHFTTFNFRAKFLSLTYSFIIQRKNNTPKKANLFFQRSKDRILRQPVDLTFLVSWPVTNLCGPMPISTDPHLVNCMNYRQRYNEGETLTSA